VDGRQPSGAPWLLRFILATVAAAVLAAGADAVIKMVARWTPKQRAFAEGLAVPVIMLAPIMALKMVFEQSDLAIYGHIMYSPYWFWGLIVADAVTGLVMTARRLRRATRQQRTHD
jgi:hypothetical protein